MSLRHSIETGASARRGGATAVLGSVASPSASTSEPGWSAAVPTIASSRSGVAMLTTNSPDRRMLRVVSLGAPPLRFSSPSTISAGFWPKTLKNEKRRLR